MDRNTPHDISLDRVPKGLSGCGLNRQSTSDVFTEAAQRLFDGYPL
jgi:hypothetical protein